MAKGGAGVRVAGAVITLNTLQLQNTQSTANKTKYALLGQFRRLPICQSSALLTMCTKDIDTIDLSMPPVQQQHTAKLQTAKLQTLHGLLDTPALPLSNSANHALLRG